MAELAEDRFLLAVLGGFNRGKSSLLNAVIRRELLPTGTLPVTSAVTTLKFGPDERLVIRFQGRPWPEVRPVRDLADWVTERNDPGNRKKVSAVTIEFPHPFLRRGIELVDTPGIGSAISANSGTTHAFLPSCDAVVFVTGADAPLAASELTLLGAVRRHVHKVFFVVNKVDLIPEEDLRDALEFVRGTLGRRIGARDVRLFPLSCKLALAGDPGSGLGALEQHLSRFLAQEKSETFLTTIAWRALGLAGGGTGDRRFETIRAKLRALAEPIGPETPAQEEEGFSGAVEGCSPRRSPGDQGGVAVAGLDPGSEERAEPPPEVLGALARTRACTVCDHLYQFTFDFLARWQHAIAAEESAQAAFAAELGFCPFHMSQLATLSSPMGASIGFARLVRHVSELLGSADGPEWVGKLVRDSTTCRLCAHLREEEAARARALATLLSQAEGRRSFASSRGVCLRHLRSILAVASHSEVAEFLLSDAARRLEELAEDMGAFALKTEAPRRHLRNRDEEDAYLRAIIHLAGKRSVSVPWSVDGRG